MKRLTNALVFALIPVIIISILIWIKELISMIVLMMDLSLSNQRTVWLLISIFITTFIVAVATNPFKN